MTTRRSGPEEVTPATATGPQATATSLVTDRQAMIRDLVMEAVRTALRDGAAQAEDPRAYLTEAVREVTLAVELLGPAADAEGNALRTVLTEAMSEAAAEIAHSRRL